MVSAYIALGSNVGDRLSNLQRAIDALKSELNVVKASAVYETAPMYVVDQPAFLNAAIEAQTDLAPLDLLKLLKRIEKQVGRHDRERFGPREVDLDLISYGVLQYRYAADEKIVLELPHPRTGERRFVVQPLYDVNPSAKLAPLGRIEDLLTQTADQEKDIERRNDAVLSI